VREVFHKARQAAPCIIFFDEIDFLVAARGASGSENQVGERVLSQFLTEMDGVEELKGVLVLGATNRADMLDPAILRPGRFDEHVEIPLPDALERKEIFAVHLRDKPMAPGVDLDQLAIQSGDCSGAEIAPVCHRAALSAVRRMVAQSKEGAVVSATELRITLEELQAALAEFQLVAS
jgi:transitional endoplasmic reticulum ATPase